MRVSFLGKGGSGKTTIAAGFVYYLSKVKNVSHVIGIDADLNVHLSLALDLAVPKSLYLGGRIKEIKDYLRGGRLDLGDKEMLATTPPSLASNFILPNSSDPFLEKFAFQTGNISLLTVGTYEKEDIGNACYHGKLNSIEYILHHLLDGRNDYVVTDANAGIDNLATSLFLAYDLNIFVVEPTLRSVNVYKDFLARTEREEILTKVVVNKWKGEEDLEFIQSHVNESDIIAKLPYSDHVARFERGETSALQDFVHEQNSVFSLVEKELNSSPKDWKLYLERLKISHEKQSVKWYNGFYGTSLEEGIDQQFSYEKVMLATELVTV